MVPDALEEIDLLEEVLPRRRETVVELRRSLDWGVVLLVTLVVVLGIHGPIVMLEAGLPRSWRTMIELPWIHDWGVVLLV